MGKDEGGFQTVSSAHLFTLWLQASDDGLAA